jgi:predicted Zn-dependent peptidase
MDIKKYTLDNGLRVILHKDSTSPMMAVNLLYDVGARDENPEKTGFAHLFEHLMFGGSVNIPNYDTVLEEVGAQNNAFTSNDITNYYVSVPKENIETALWLESDRMLSLAFTPKSLEVQRNVVMEEFKQNYLNQPYGDAYMLIREMAYKKHPYRWSTIGKELKHIEDATMEDVKSFFFEHYAPNNCILSICGDLEYDSMLELIKKYFDDIPRRKVKTRNLPIEPKQEEARSLHVERDVPANMLYKVYKMSGRADDKYYATDLLSDILSRGKSSVLYQELVQNQGIFTSISAYVSASIDPGLFFIVGQVADDITLEDANKQLEELIEEFKTQPMDESSLVKVKNKFEISKVYSLAGVLNKATELCFHELIGEAEDIENVIAKYQNIEVSEITQIAAEVLKKDNCSTLFYHAK